MALPTSSYQVRPWQQKLCQIRKFTQMLPDGSVRFTAYPYLRPGLGTITQFLSAFPPKKIIELPRVKTAKPSSGRMLFSFVPPCKHPTTRSQILEGLLGADTAPSKVHQRSFQDSRDKWTLSVVSCRVQRSQNIVSKIWRKPWLSVCRHTFFHFDAWL